MTILTVPPPEDLGLDDCWPDDTQLPESDGTFVHNFQEHPQSMLLTDSVRPVLQRLHPDGQYCIGQDCRIYWNRSLPPGPLVYKAVAPDWFYIANVPPTLGGRVRRSYVMWREWIAPFFLAEFVSGDGSEERDQTPWAGKLWIYEQALRAPFYAIYEVNPGRVTVHHLVGGRYQPLPANARGHFEIAPLGIELGIWQGQYQNTDLPWLRCWDLQGNLLLTGEERAEQEAKRAEQEAKRAERLAAQLRALGVEPEA